MSETIGNRPDRTTYELLVTTDSLEITTADRIEVEDAENPKYLRLKNGDFRLPQAVFLTVDGQRIEITLDSLPEDVLPQDAPPEDPQP